jgi:hypothetical protein
MMRAMVDDPKKAGIRALIWAGVLEAVCVGAGIIAWSLTGSWMWIVIGVVASLGFTLPAIIKFVRDKKEERR